MLIAVLLLGGCLGISSRSVRETDTTIKRYSIQMTGYSPAQVDDYVAVSVDAIPGYIGQSPSSFPHPPQFSRVRAGGQRRPSASYDIVRMQSALQGHGLLEGHGHLWLRRVPHLIRLGP